MDKITIFNEDEILTFKKYDICPCIHKDCEYHSKCEQCLKTHHDKDTLTFCEKMDIEN